MNVFIMFHAERYKLILDKNNICYCDSFKGNQDPYIFAPRFLHSYCKINSLPISKMKKGDTVIWLTKDNSQKGKWFCDLIFVIDEIKIWNPLPGYGSFDYKNDYRLSDITKYITHKREGRDHFYWAGIDHPKGENAHKRITLFANPKESFQPLDSDNNLICMDELCHEIPELDFSTIKGGPRGYPKTVIDENQFNKIKEFIDKRVHKKLHGDQIQKIREKHEKLLKE